MHLESNHPNELPVRLTFFTRPDCSLCDSAWFVVQRAVRGLNVEVEKVDISATGHEQWQQRFADHIPVVFLDGQEHCRHRVYESQLKTAIRERIATSRTPS